MKWGFYQLKVLLLVALTYLEQSPPCAISKPNLFAGKELGNHVFLTVTNLINIFKLMYDNFFVQKSWLENAFHLRPPIFALYETLKFLWGTQHAKGM